MLHELSVAELDAYDHDLNPTMDDFSSPIVVGHLAAVDEDDCVELTTGLHIDLQRRPDLHEMLRAVLDGGRGPRVAFAFTDGSLSHVRVLPA